MEPDFYRILQIRYGEYEEDLIALILPGAMTTFFAGLVVFANLVSKHVWFLKSETGPAIMVGSLLLVYYLVVGWMVLSDKIVLHDTGYFNMARNGTFIQINGKENLDRLPIQRTSLSLAFLAYGIYPSFLSKKAKTRWANLDAAIEPLDALVNKKPEVNLTGKITPVAKRLRRWEAPLLKQEMFRALKEEKEIGLFSLNKQGLHLASYLLFLDKEKATIAYKNDLRIDVSYLLKDEDSTQIAEVGTLPLEWIGQLMDVDPAVIFYGQYVWEDGSGTYGSAKPF
jgi:hypothetical protein